MNTNLIIGLGIIVFLIVIAFGIRGLLREMNETHRGWGDDGEDDDDRQ